MSKFTPAFKAKVAIEAIKGVDELRSGIDKFIRFYNYQRPHQSLDVLLPAMRYGIAV